MPAFQNIDAVRKTSGYRAVLAALGAMTAGSWAGAGTLAIRVVDAQGKPISGAAVTIQDVATKRPHAAPIDAVMDQIGLAFTPSLLVVPVGSRVSFPNSDAVSHQVYSFSPAKKFQLPLYRGKPYPPQIFDNPGLVTVGCNIHDDMLGHIIVTDAPFYGLTSKDGTYSKASLSTGDYELKVWRPQTRDMTKPWTATVKIHDVDDVQTLELKSPDIVRVVQRTAAKASWDSY
jgi:plastocyanin